MMDSRGSGKQRSSWDALFVPDDLNPFLVWKNVTVAMPDKKPRFLGRRKPPTRVLHGVNGFAGIGRLMAVMGSSGAGKTTLLNYISGRIAHDAVIVDGIVTVSGVRITDPADMRLMSGYVPQDDRLHPSLTVREYLTMAVRFRLGGTMSKAEVNERVEALLVELALMKCEKSFIGIAGISSGISGGERKRLSFAAELCHDPKIIFCDEPTSALDSFAAAKAVNFLKKICAKGVAILCTIHQPSSQTFALFDDLFILYQGRVAYTGPLEKAKEHFESIGYDCPVRFNPADYYISILSMKPTILGEEQSQDDARRQAICEAFLGSPAGIDLKKRIEGAKEVKSRQRLTKIVKFERSKKASWCLQLCQLIRRSHNERYRDQPEFRLHLLNRLLMSLLLGMVYTRQKDSPDPFVRGQNLMGALYALTVDSMITEIFVILYTFVPVIGRSLYDIQNGLYALSSFFVAKWIVFMCYAVFDVLLFAIPYYFLAGLDTDPVIFFKMLGTLFYASICFAGLALMAVSYIQSLDTSIVVTVTTYLPMIWAAGTFGNYNAVRPHVRWLQWYSLLRYGLEAALILQTKNTDYPKERDILFERLGLKIDNLPIDFAALGGFLVVALIIAYVGLFRRSKQMKG